MRGAAADAMFSRRNTDGDSETFQMSKGRGGADLGVRRGAGFVATLILLHPFGP